MGLMLEDDAIADELTYNALTHQSDDMQGREASGKCEKHAPRATNSSALSSEVLVPQQRVLKAIQGVLDDTKKILEGNEKTTMAWEIALGKSPAGLGDQ